MILFIILLFVAIRLITLPFRIGGRLYNPYGYGYGGCYGYHRYRRRGPAHLLIVLLVLFALSHLFGGHHHHHHWL